jgi:hypothetical protein
VQQEEKILLQMNCATSTTSLSHWHTLLHQHSIKLEEPSPCNANRLAEAETDKQAKHLMFDM